MAKVRATRADFLEDAQGRTFADVVNDPEQPFDEVLEFFDDGDRQRRMEESELHHDRSPLAGVVRELESQPAIDRFLGGAPRPAQYSLPAGHWCAGPHDHGTSRMAEDWEKRFSWSAGGTRCWDSEAQHRRLGVLVRAGGKIRTIRRHAVPFGPREMPRARVFCAKPSSKRPGKLASTLTRAEGSEITTSNERPNHHERPFLAHRSLFQPW